VHKLGVLTADGANQTKKRYIASRWFNDVYGLFVDAAATYRLEYIDPSRGPSRTGRLEGISRDELERASTDAGHPYADVQAAPFEVSFDDAGTALLTIRTFYYGEGGGWTHSAPLSPRPLPH